MNRLDALALTNTEKEQARVFIKCGDLNTEIFDFIADDDLASAIRIFLADAALVSVANAHATYVGEVVQAVSTNECIPTSFSHNKTTSFLGSFALRKRAATTVVANPI